MSESWECLDLDKCVFEKGLDKKEKEEDFLGSLIGGINDMKIAKASGKIILFIYLLIIRGE